MSLSDLWIRGLSARTDWLGYVCPRARRSHQSGAFEICTRAARIVNYVELNGDLVISRPILWGGIWGRAVNGGIYLAFGVLLEDMFTYTLVVRLRRQNWMIRHEDRISYSWTNRQYYGWLIYGPKENPVDMRWRPFFYSDYRGMSLINVILVVKGSRSLLNRKRSFKHQNI